MAFLNFRANYNTNKLAVELARCPAGRVMCSTYGSGDRLETPRSGLPGAALPQSPGRGRRRRTLKTSCCFEAGIQELIAMPVSFQSRLMSAMIRAGWEVGKGFFLLPRLAESVICRFHVTDTEF